MASNRLKLNDDKTEFIWIGSKRRLRQVQPNPLSVSGASVMPSNVVRDLGVYVDGDLSMTDHIKKLSRSCFFQLRQLRTIRRSLSKEATRLLLHAFVVSRLDYCNALFTGLPSKSIGNLQVIQNSAARLFGGLHINTTMSPLQWRMNSTGCVFRSESVLNWVLWCTKLFTEKARRIWGNCAFQWATISICPVTGRQTEEIWSSLELTRRHMAGEPSARLVLRPGTVSQLR